MVEMDGWDSYMCRFTAVKKKTDFRRDNLFSFQRVSSLYVIMYKTTMQQVTIELIFNKRRMNSDLPMD